MKPRPVKTKIKRMVRVLGNKQKVADRLNIHLSYVYELEKGTVPGKHLYIAICNEFDKITAKK